MNNNSYEIVKELNNYLVKNIDTDNYASVQVVIDDYKKILFDIANRNEEELKKVIDELVFELSKSILYDKISSSKEL